MGVSGHCTVDAWFCGRGRSFVVEGHQFCEVTGHLVGRCV